MTLPVIYLLSHSTGSDRRKVINIIKNHHNDNMKVREVMEMVLRSGGIEYATQKMNVYKNDALQILTSFPDSPSRRSLEELVAFTTERKK